MLRFEHLVFLEVGETPWSYRSNPGELPGPWEGETVAAVEAAYRSETGDERPWTEWWEREGEAGASLWIALAPDKEV